MNSSTTKKIFAGFVVALGLVTIMFLISQNDTNIDQPISSKSTPSDQAGEMDMQDNSQPSDQNQDAIDLSSEIEIREEEVSQNPTDEITKNLSYNDGEYFVDSEYTVPNGTVHDMDMTFTVRDDMIVDVVVEFNKNTGGGSTDNQSRFMRAMQPLVIGTAIDDLALSRVGGASITTKAFNDALEVVKNRAS